MEQLQFYNNLHHISFVFLTGACRVGKTSLASYLGQHPHLEFLDEPWEIMMFPFLMEKFQNNELLGSYFKSMLGELANDIMLYRRANLRFNDASTLWKCKTPNKIYERLLLVKNRDQVKETLIQEQIKILLVLPETTPFIQFFINQVPNLRIIHLTRNGIEVATEIAQKGWFSVEQLKFPKNNQLCHLIRYQDQTFYIPWWVSEEDAGTFISINDFERGLWYWHFFNTAFEQQQSLLSDSSKHNIINFNSFELFNNPNSSCEKLFNFLELSPTQLLSSFSKPIMQPKMSKIQWSKAMPSQKRSHIEHLLATH